MSNWNTLYNYNFYRRRSARNKIPKASEEPDIVPEGRLDTSDQPHYHPKIREIILYKRIDGHYWPAKVVGIYEGLDFWRFQIVPINDSTVERGLWVSILKGFLKPFNTETSRAAMLVACQPTVDQRIYTDLQRAYAIADEYIRQKKTQRKY